ncbi:hypothetical protein B7463_g1609, partial [Scytalidium lignicola]
MESDQQPITVSLRELETESVTLQTLEQAFGPSSLGILIVKDLPAQFHPLRKKLLTYASSLAQLSAKELDSLTNAESHYNVGWSHGKEALKDGQYDTMKGSYYVGVMSTNLQASTERSQQPFEYPNIWPAEDLLPGFRQTFEELGTMIVDIALVVAKACDQFAVKSLPSYEPGLLERVLKESTTTRARLLHYFPPRSDIERGAVDEEDDSWCALHVDDGCLTGLTSALYVDESKFSSSTTVEMIKDPDYYAGLYIRSRTSEVVKVNIPEDCLAFQTGSALQLMTKGALKAVPHFVRGPTVGSAVARNTLAVFTQPNLNEILDETGITFGQHIRESDEKHA